MMLVRKTRVFLCVAAALALAVFLASCPGNDEDEKPEEEEEGVVEMPPGERSMIKLNKNGQRIVITSWSEQGVDPRTIMGYQLQDGTPLIDNVVQLYGMSLTRDTEDCSKVPERPWCNKIGVHFCTRIDFLYERMFTNYNITVKPVRDKGHKYLINIIPGIPVGILYHWPMEKWYPWKDLVPTDLAYPYGKEAADKLLDQLLQIWKDTPFDGLAYDEEYGTDIGRTAVVDGVSKTLSGYPTDYPKANTAEGWQISGGNLLRFAHEANVKIFGNRWVRTSDTSKYEYVADPRGFDIFEDAKFAQIPSAEWKALNWSKKSIAAKEVWKRNMEQSTKRLIFESYEIRAGGSIPESYTYPTDPTDPAYDARWPGLKILRTDLIDRTYNASYGGFASNSGSGMPRHRYGPASISLGWAAGGPEPALGESGIRTKSRDLLKYNYGVIMFYHLTSRGWILKNRVKNYFGPGDAGAEYYLSDMTRILFDQPVFYSGPDYGGD